MSGECIDCGNVMCLCDKIIDYNTNSIVIGIDVLSKQSLEISSLKKQNSIMRSALEELRYGIYHHSHVSKIAEEALLKCEEV